MAVDPASLAVKAALMVAQMAMTAMTKIEGPRLDSLDATTADYGTPLIYFWGKRRLEGCPIFWAEKLREKKTTSKTKGGKYAEYKYFGTFAVAIADHEIDTVSRIWLDKHLCLDMTKAGPISVLGGLFAGLTGAPVKLSEGRNMRIYLGTETQLPDPRMEAWCEDRYGADSCPAYRGVSYIVFEDIPLEKFGNRIPQVTIEAINVSSPNYLYETIDPTPSLVELSKDGGKILFYSTGSGREFELWDVPTRTKLIGSEFAAETTHVSIAPNGTIWATGGTLGDTLSGFSESGALLVTVPTGTFTDYVFALGAQIYMRSNLAADDQIISYAGAGATCDIQDIGFAPHSYIEDLEGRHWAIGIDSTTFYYRYIQGNAEYSIATPGGVSGVTAAFFNPDNNLFVITGTTVWIIDVATNTVLDSAVVAGLGSDSIDSALMTHPGAARFWGDEKEISTTTLEVLRTITLTNWVSVNTSQQWYLPVLHALLGQTLATGTFTIRYLDRPSSVGADLADVVTDVAGWCGLTGIDVDDLTQTVSGYSVTQGSGKDMISPLLDIHDVDARPHDFTVQFLSRGDAASATVSVADFVRDGDEPRYTVTVKQDTDLPRQVSLSFADANKDQQTNTVLAQRPLSSVDAERKQQIDLTTYVATPGEAQKFVDRYHRRKWNERETVTNALTAQYLGLEPADVLNVQLDDVTQSLKVQKMTLSQGRINVEWSRDYPSLATLGTGTGAEMGGRDDDELFIPSPTKGFIKDFPLFEDGHSSVLPLLYYGAANYTGDWPGAVIYESDADGDEYFSWKAVDSSDGAAWGYTLNALADASPNVFDGGNTISVKCNTTLTSCTEAEIDADPTLNLALVGDELINFTTATLEADGTYTLSGFKRGRRGTEWACSTHEIGDEFVLADDLAHDGFGLSDVGTSLFHRAQTLGRDVATAPTIETAFAGNTLKPYAPCAYHVEFSGSDLVYTWDRRTRVGGAWTGGSAIPLSEASEEYELDIYDGAAVVRTITVTSTTATYTAAQQTTDFGAPLALAPTIRLYQMSDAVGRGFALAA